MSFLPIPDISDDALSYSFKQFNGKDDSSKYLRPPKLYTKHQCNFINKSLNSSTAHLISFRHNNSNRSKLDPTTNNMSDCSLVPISYVNKNESYFENYFEKLTKIGEGSFGEVFKVKSKEDGQYYAVKKSKYLFRSETYRQERLEEVKRYEEFSEHEHCVTLYKAWQQNDRLYMQMELCRCSLDAYVIEKKSISEIMIWSILLDLLLALKSLHDKDLIHLDIKLDNILITDDETCKLGDFGLVVNLNRENLHLATEGDSRYIAPELMQGEFTKAADIFSLGLTILELSCNLELPPNGPLWQQLRSGVFPTEFYTLLSNDLQFVIKAMMEPDPKNRPSVDNLLNYKKLVDLRRERAKWEFLKRIKNLLKNLTRFFMNKMCNLKYKLKQYLSLTKKKPVKQLDGSGDDDGLLDNYEYDDDDEGDNVLLEAASTPFSNVNSAYSLFNKPLSPVFSNVANSTPLNHHGSNRMKRIELSRSHLCFDVSDDETNMYHDGESRTPMSSMANTSLTADSVPPLMCKKLFTSDDSD